MRVNLKKVFSIIDGRLSTEIGDVYEMLNFIYNCNLMTHQIPTAMRTLTKENPKWFSDIHDFISEIKYKHNINDFAELMSIIDSDYRDIEFDLGNLSIKIDFLAGVCAE